MSMLTIIRIHDILLSVLIRFITVLQGRKVTDLLPLLPINVHIWSLRSGDITPSLSGSSSRPGSALSTQNASSVGTGTVVRRPASAPRRPRPASIAGTGVSADNSASRLGINGERPKSTIDKEGASKPPLPKVHAAPRKSVPSKPETPKRTITEKVSRPNSVKASPKLTPKATPLQSPGDGSTKLDTTISKQAVEVTNTTIVKTETINGKTEVSVEEEQTVVTTTPSGEVLTETTSNVQNQELIAPVSAPADGQNAIAANQEDAAKVVGESVKTNEEVKIAEVEKPAEAVQQANAVVEENNTIPVQQVKPDVAKTEEVKSADAPAPVENGDSVDMTGK
ncbi:proteoglycan 4-like [Ctenocephalides felis]|uniref:proteoglycan 4-like n=1 Tax=Ctenocephalides felis TaxID=7515 RepID=UPI000E6E24C6|nr:proteoglycan 4-like [Ctenocephalides felis]